MGVHHDFFKKRYEDGTGGCDGCLNWSGMGWIGAGMEIKVSKRNTATSEGQ